MLSVQGDGAIKQMEVDPFGELQVQVPENDLRALLLSILRQLLNAQFLEQGQVLVLQTPLEITNRKL